MSDVMMPTNLSVAKVSFRYIDNTGISRAMFTRRLRVASFGGDTLGASIQLSPHGGASSKGQMERAQLRAWLASLQGPQNPTYLYDPSYRMRGSFPTGELLTNNTFENGTTGWGSGGEATLTVADRVARSTRTRITSGTAAIATIGSADPYVQYAPYCGRAMIMKGSGSYPNGFSINWGSASGAVDYLNGASQVAFGLLSQVFVPAVTSAFFTVRDISASPLLAGDYISIPYLSVSRCALVDNGPNLLLQSNVYDNASWTKTNASITANIVSGPDGAPTADALIDTGTNGVHQVSQNVTVSSSAADFVICGFAKANALNFCVLAMEEAASTTVAAWFNLISGAVGSTSVGPGWSNARSFMVSMGNGWYFCALVARKTTSATSITARMGAANVDGSTFYAGSSNTAIYIAGTALAQSSVPMRITHTTSAANTGTSPTGTAMYVKGLPASTNGLLLVGDQFEVITSRGSELKIVTAPLNSDAAGLGYLQFTPPLRGSVADNAPIIVHQPMGRFVFTGEAVGWDEEPGFITSASAEFEEA